MATLTISLTSGPVTGSKSWTATDADVQALINYMASKFAPREGGPALTPAQALSAWAQDWVSRSTAEVRQKQLRDATASLNVPGPSFT